MTVFTPVYCNTDKVRNMTMTMPTLTTAISVITFCWKASCRMITVSRMPMKALTMIWAMRSRMKLLWHRSKPTMATTCSTVNDRNAVYVTIK